MVPSLSKGEDASTDPVSSVQREIAVLEAELERIKKDLGAFESKIHARLDKEIARTVELSDLYKAQKKEKKAKRLEQKKRGKNWVEPKQLPQHHKVPKQEVAAGADEQKALKRLYKDAVVQVHPDKFMHSGEHDRIQQANALTARLNAIYKKGDLEELINFYQFVVLGNASHEMGSNREVLPDSKLRLESLLRNKQALLDQLGQLKSTYTYHVLISYENPLSFIDELHLQLLEKIKQLEKRTRKARGA